MKVKLNDYASNKLRAVMRERRVTTKKICELLKKTFNISLNEQSFNNKISRANFSANFFFQCMYVLDVMHINFDTNNIEIGVNNEKN
ncbi:DUF6471 domain-containing protein [Sulfuricurvum sp.]|uniref:DUF6471 domain-containing protein n=1 Tax=Sulfuricurvum sp. TaxID=2025608 RepID=UPI003428F222